MSKWIWVASCMHELDLLQGFIYICLYVYLSVPIKIMDWFEGVCICGCVGVGVCTCMSERRAPPSDLRGRSALILINIQGALTLDGSKVDYWHLGNQEWSRRELNYTNTTLICLIRSQWQKMQSEWSNTKSPQRMESLASWFCFPLTRGSITIGQAQVSVNCLH